MTNLGKTFLGFMAIAVVIAGTLALRARPSSPTVRAQLTSSQVAELQQKAPEVAPRPSPTRAEVPPPPPEEPEIEDGNGS